jgi:hypothetical protein
MITTPSERHRNIGGGIVLNTRKEQASIRLKQDVPNSP